MAKILVTGGCGYIGSHTIVDLLANGFEVISIDNHARSSNYAIAAVEKITGTRIKNYEVDLKNFDDTLAVFQENPDIAGIIHFAAYKAVGESVEEPLFYYENNIGSLVNVLKCILLRYFNPVGAHPSALIGELPIGRPQNLVPAITQTAIGKLPKMMVYGNDYPTRDGSCIRDYIHVCDIASAHTLALQYLLAEKNTEACEVFNLGTGNGISVLEAITTFETVSGTTLNYEIGPRRAGDIVAIYANNEKAINKLGWKINYTIEDMMRTAWAWEKEVQLKESIAKN